MDKPIKQFYIHGIVYGAACRMTSEQRADPWLVCSAICAALDDYYDHAPKLGTPDVIVPPTDIFDTEHTDDLPADIKPKKPTPKPAPEPEPVEQEPELPLIDVLWAERPIDLVNNYIGSYSNPCSTSVGQCRQPCVQTELWLYDKVTDTLSVVDVEFETLEKLHACLDPHVEYTKKHRDLTYVDFDIADKQESMLAECRKARKKITSTERVAELYNMGWKPAQIAREMGINPSTVYQYKQNAKARGLIK